MNSQATPLNELIPFARKALRLPGSVPLQVHPLARRGSERCFFRLHWEESNSAILIHYDPARKENARYACLAIFLRAKGVPVPGVIASDDGGFLLLEDLGETDLFSLRALPWEERRVLYEKTLAATFRLHLIPPEDLPARAAGNEDFGPGLYRFERDYFRDHFVRDVCRLEITNPFARELEGELSALADRLGETEPALIHRDLQSQNVLIRAGDPFFIDFQGLRRGSLFYDLGALLGDPYVSLARPEQEELLAFYLGLRQDQGDLPIFERRFREASVQRLLQALGAYGFLGLARGLTGFLAHIPAGLDQLELALGCLPDFARLGELVLACRNRLKELQPSEAIREEGFRLDIRRL